MKSKIVSQCKISSSICTSPIGHLTLNYCSQGLHSISQHSTINDRTFSPDPKQFVEIQSSKGDDVLPKNSLEWLKTYFHCDDQNVPPPRLCPSILTDSNSFHEHVWSTLLQHVPFGKTITYAQLADLAGNKRAARAVGTAMKRNPFQLLVPCHRVIRSDGKEGNYSGGDRNRVKLWLLKHEENLQ